MGPLFRHATMNIIFRMCYNKRFDENAEPEFLDLSTSSSYFEFAFDPAHWIPWTRNLPHKGLKKLKEHSIIRDRIVGKWIKQVRANKKTPEQ